MSQPIAEITIRPARKTDMSFIFSFSSVLAEGAKLDWHKGETVQTFQRDYIAEMMAETSLRNITLILERNGIASGFIHARERKDDISGEVCGTVPLLAIKEEAQGFGAGRLLLEAAEDWAKTQGFRLLHLEVFSTNEPARGFYQNLGFKPETINLIKPLG